MTNGPAQRNMQPYSVAELLAKPPKSAAKGLDVFKQLMGSPRPKALTIRAFAKINLFLHVVGKREDGYHLLDSLVAFVGIADTLRIRQAQHYRLISDGAFANALPLSEDNTITKTVHLLARKYKRKPDIFVELSKQLPVKTGFGSSAVDAGATIRALHEIWGFKWRDDDFIDWANRLGADVPMCVYQRPAFISGIGEMIEPARGLPKLHVVLARPDAEISSREVFDRFTYNGPKPLLPREVPITPQAFIQWLQEKTNNDLMLTAAALAPKVLRCYRALVKQPGCLLARLSGAGPGCFALFYDAAEAQAAALAVKQDYPQWWVRPAPLLLSTPI